METQYTVFNTLEKLYTDYYTLERENFVLVHSKEKLEHLNTLIPTMTRLETLDMSLNKKAKECNIAQVTYKRHLEAYKNVTEKLQIKNE